MTTLELRNKLHRFIDKADKHKLKQLEDLLEKDSPVPEWVYQEIEEENEKLEKGRIKLSEWKEVKLRLQNVYGI
jgi:hypothetical protein